MSVLPASERAVVVTGASSGIGAATARTLAAAGHPVVLGARRVERLEALADEIRAGGGTATAAHLDLCDPASIEDFVRAAGEAVGEVDVLVSNAGDVQPIDAHGDPESFTRQMTVNLLGPQRLLHLLLPGMVARRRGDVVFVTSEVARVPRPHVAGYVASKAGLEALAETLSMELEGSGVRSTMVRPGPVASEQGSTWDADAINRIVPSWQRWGLLRNLALLAPDDVADAVLHAISLPSTARYRVIEVQPNHPVREEGP